MEDRAAYTWPQAERWLSVDEIAAYLGIKRDTVYKWISEKQMPAHRMGRLWKFRKEEVDEWVKSGGADYAPECRACHTLNRSDFQKSGQNRRIQCI
jgi:excisionase family DNA binding protein